MMSVHEELEKLADEMEDRPLIILDCEIDKDDPRQVYGALCWIEIQLTTLLQMREAQPRPAAHPAWNFTGDDHSYVND